MASSEKFFFSICSNILTKSSLLKPLMQFCAEYRDANLLRGVDGELLYFFFCENNYTAYYIEFIQ